MRLRLRLVHKLFVALALASTLAVTLVALLISQVLSTGFERMLTQIDEDRIEGLTRLAVVRYEREGNLDGLANLWQSFAVPAADAINGKPNRSLANLRQIVIEDAQGKILTAPSAELLAQRSEMLRRDVVAQGKKVGTVSLTRLPKNVQGMFPDAARKLNQAIAGSAGMTLLIALLGSGWLARRLARDIVQVTQSTARIARGDLSAQVMVRGSDEIAELGHHVNDMAATLRAAEDSRKRWLAQIAHELRNPLAALAAEIEALQDKVRPVTDAALASLREEVDHLSHITNDLHQLALAEMDQLQVDLSPTDAASLLERCVQRWDDACQRAGLSLRTDLVSADVCIDGMRMTQVLDNLITNSLRYTDAPGSIHLQCMSREHEVWIVVEDSAPGVSEENLVQLFTPLFKADPARSRIKGGSGLGLALVKALVQSMHGQVTAQSSALGGIRILIKLPHHSTT